MHKAAVGDLQGETSGELPQELVHQRTRRTGDRRGAVEAARNITKLAWWHPVEPILATDRAFDGIDGLEKIDPADVQAVATLVG